MDLSPVALRRSLIARELELDRSAAPEIYCDVLPVTQGDTGLALNGDSPVVDWGLRIGRFPAENELERVASSVDETLGACDVFYDIAFLVMGPCHRDEDVCRDLFARRATMLAAGHSVVVDATFVDPQLGAAAQDMAARVSIHGLWLEASERRLEGAPAVKAG